MWASLTQDAVQPGCLDLLRVSGSVALSRRTGFGVRIQHRLGLGRRDARRNRHRGRRAALAAGQVLLQGRCRCLVCYGPLQGIHLLALRQASHRTVMRPRQALYPILDRHVLGHPDTVGQRLIRHAGQVHRLAVLLAVGCLAVDQSIPDGELDRRVESREGLHEVQPCVVGERPCEGQPNRGQADVRGCEDVTHCRTPS